MNRMLFTALAVFAAAPLTMTLPSPASAQTITDCQSMISTLRLDVLAVTFIGRNDRKDQLALLDRLDAASDRLAAGKNAEAVDKLTDFIDKVDKFAAAGHLSLADASLLDTEANAAIECINTATAV